MCQGEARRVRSGSASPSRVAIRCQTGASSRICSSNGITVPSKAAGSTPNQPAMRSHIQLQRKTSPLTMLNASLAAAGVSAAQRSWRASWRASVMSVRPFHCAGEPGKRKGRPVSRQSVA